MACCSCLSLHILTDNLDNTDGLIAGKLVPAQEVAKMISESAPKMS